MSAGVKSTEFWFGCLAVACATALLLAGEVSEDTWKWTATTTSGAYVFGRSLVKACGARARQATTVSNVFDSHENKVTVSPLLEETEEKPDDPLTGVDSIRKALERNADALSALQKDLSPD